jgi:hypothetical protein
MLDQLVLRSEQEVQDRYAGDIGDFVKLGLLRAISPGYALGLAWYHVPDEGHNDDGRHIGYTAQPETYSALDPYLFKHLGVVVVGDRKIASLLPALPSATITSQTLDVAGVPFHQRRQWRQVWFSKVLTDLEGCDLIFADPDNGLVDDSDHRKGKAVFSKQLPLAEAKALADGRCAVVYHHNTRRRGGHDAEVDYWLAQFGVYAIAVRATAYSPRTFFILNPTPEIEERVRDFCIKWRAIKVRIHDLRR